MTTLLIFRNYRPCIDPGEEESDQKKRKRENLSSVKTREKRQSNYQTRKTSCFMSVANRQEKAKSQHKSEVTVMNLVRF